MALDENGYEIIETEDGVDIVGPKGQIIGSILGYIGKKIAKARETWKKRDDEYMDAYNDEDGPNCIGTVNWAKNQDDNRDVATFDEHLKTDGNYTDDRNKAKKWWGNLFGFRVKKPYSHGTDHAGFIYENEEMTLEIGKEGSRKDEPFDARPFDENGYQKGGGRIQFFSLNSKKGKKKK